MRWSILSAFLLLSACGGDGVASNTGTSTEPAATTASADSAARAARVAARRRLGPQGGGDLQIGITQAQLRGRLDMVRGDLAIVACRYLDGVGHPPGLLFMLRRDSLARIDVRDTAYATEEGVRIGDTEARVRSVYGARVATSRHKYTAGGHYLTVTPSDARYRLVFETDGQRVRNWRLGRYPEVTWPEGCP